MVYLILKELMTMSDDVIIVMSSLTKDMNSQSDLFRANAIRVLCLITDVKTNSIRISDKIHSLYHSFLVFFFFL